MIDMSQRDSSQINRYEHDDDLCAKRVIIVGGSELSVDSSGIVDAVKEGLKDLKVEIPSSCNCKPEIQVVEKQVFIPSEPQVIHIKESIPVVSSVVQRVEVPVIVKEIEIKIVEIPVIVKEVQIVEMPAVQNVVNNKSDLIKNLAIVALLIVDLVLILKK